MNTSQMSFKASDASTLGVDSHLNVSEVVAFPNPVVADMTIRLNSKRGGGVNSSLYNLSGQLVIRQQYFIIAGQTELHMDLSKAGSGNFILVVSHDGQSNTLKVIKK
jgi:hypothetical protein